MPVVTTPALRQTDRNLGSALSLKGAGVMEVLRITRLLKGGGDMLRFAGVAASSTSHVKGLEISFLADTGRPPSPTLDETSGIIRMFYPVSERAQVEQMLRGKRKRFCYFWRSQDNALRQAWFVTSG